MFVFIRHAQEVENDLWAGDAWCSCCNSQSRFHLKKIKHKVYLYGVLPILSFTKKRYLVCDSCEKAAELKQKDYNKIRDEQMDRLENDQFPEEVVRNDFSPKNLIMHWKYIRLIVSLLFAVGMTALATGLAAEESDIVAFMFQTLFMTSIGFLPASFTIPDTITALKKQKKYKLCEKSQYFPKYQISNTDQSGANRKKSSKYIVDMLVLLLWLLFFFIPVITFWTTEKPSSDSDYESEYSDEYGEYDYSSTICFDHVYTTQSSTPPTYTSLGIETKVCEKCGFETNDYLPRLTAVETTFLEKYVAEYYNSDETESTEELDEQNKKRVITFDISIKNVTDKDIECIKGSFFIDIKTYRVKLECEFNEHTIKAGKSTTYSFYGYEYSCSPLSPIEIADLPSNETLYNATLEELDYSFTVNEIVFSE